MEKGLRKFHVFLGERYYIVYANIVDVEEEELVFVRIVDDLFTECGRFKRWDAYTEELKDVDYSKSTNTTTSCS